ncbi:hypothetical protein S101189_01220 [Pediococcus acidilactici]|nr:hypothetical protein S100424_01220 [Pediococcus acidilactici]ARW28774.1 hypothetical protein S101189_01220 [Pediococcus acidilactici]KAF0370311.1 hypothetical protein GBO60_07665 [Pediococcus acidilactici]KAF0389018.1 hypothetical protein GBO67_07665 [Pediococcus acidilactici]OBR30971.1 hypothetical protein SRCM100320_00464 [Pediococcus acidilactici]
MSYMDYREYQAIMQENDYKESKAVRLFLKRAAAFNRRKKILMKREEADCGNRILNQYISQTEEQRWKAVWDAIDCAEIEQRQGFMFFEDGGGDKFMDVMIAQYKGDLSRMTALEKATYKYYELLDEMAKRAREGALAS